MRLKEFIFSFVLLAISPNLVAWGADGHRVIGLAAWELLDGTARQSVSAILGDPGEDDRPGAIATACIWPDTVRGEDEWKWSSPLHYVNIPRSTPHYDRERDCPGGRCVTEGILHFASQLGYEDQDKEKKWQAFAFLCHLVADLHQPLHAGFRDDRGANTVDIEYRGETWNLHQFWDSVIVDDRLGDERQMINGLAAAGRAEAQLGWNPEEVKAWTEESHALAADKAYPAGPVIDESFAERSWEISIVQWERAAGRLAKILNAVLGEGEVLTGD